jgi:hypothetical protein
METDPPVKRAAGHMPTLVNQRAPERWRRTWESGIDRSRCRRRRTKVPKPERAVTEIDLRRPECREGEPKDYEFDEEGAVVRKDRWEQAIRKICPIVGISSRQAFTVDGVVQRVSTLLGGSASWDLPDTFDPEDYDADRKFLLRLTDGSILRGAERIGSQFVWRGSPVLEVEGFKMEPRIHST